MEFNENQQQLPRKSPENPLLFQYHHEPKALFISRFGDNGTIMNADYCLAGDTLIKLINNQYTPIKDICNRVSNGEELYTYSINPETRQLRVSKILGGKLTRINEPTVTVTFYNGEHVICSGNHEFLTLHVGYVSAQNLTYNMPVITYGGEIARVISVVPNQNMDLYDIEVEHYHNFPITKGDIFVHNSALEMRIAAVISNDKKMAQAFLSGQDIHKANAAYMWRIPIEEVTKDLRTKAKSLGFGW